MSWFGTRSGGEWIRGRAGLAAIPVSNRVDMFFGCWVVLEKRSGAIHGKGASSCSTHIFSLVAHTLATSPDYQHCFGDAFFRERPSPYEGRLATPRSHNHTAGRAGKETLIFEVGGQWSWHMVGDEPPTSLVRFAERHLPGALAADFGYQVILSLFLPVV